MTLKLSGSYQLPFGIRLGGVLQSAEGFGPTSLSAPLLAPASGNPGKNVTYIVNRTVVPTLTQTSVGVLLDEPGTNYMDRVTQLDFNVGKTFAVRNVRLTPQIDIFNALNSNAVVSEVTTFGAALGRPARILDPRFVRFQVKMLF
jgi:hypothetical protein